MSRGAEDRAARRLRALGSGGCLAAAMLLAVVSAGPAVASEAALTIRAGSVVHRQVVGVGRDVVVEGEASSDVAALDGSVRVTGRVAGDLIVVGGDARLTSTAVVEGDVFVLGGRIEAEPGARMGGRTVAYPSVSRAWLVLLEGPALGQDPLSGVVIGAKLALMAAWLVWSLLLFATSGRGVLATAEAVREQPFRSFFVGLAGVLAAFLSAVFVAGLAASVVGLPLLALVVLLALILKMWGLVGVFFALGEWLSRTVLRRRMAPLNAALVGLLLLGGLKLVPYAGAWVWTVATLIGVGATLTSKFGRREPWFDPVPAPAVGR